MRKPPKPRPSFVSYGGSRSITNGKDFLRRPDTPLVRRHYVFIRVSKKFFFISLSFSACIGIVSFPPCKILATTITISDPIVTLVIARLKIRAWLVTLVSKIEEKEECNCASHNAALES